MNQTLLDRWSTASVEDVRAMPQEQYESIYAYFEDRNAHTENLVLQAKRFGTPQEIETSKSIRALHQRNGYLDQELFDLARELRRQLNTKSTSGTQPCGEAKELEFFRYDRSRSSAADLIRERFANN